jgi:putative transposase
VSDKYEFIDAEYADHLARPGRAPLITLMCEWPGVSKSGLYDWRSRAESATAARRKELGLIIRKAFEDSDGTYGYRRIRAELGRWGVSCGLELVRVLMRELGLEPCQPRPWRPVTTRQGAAGPIRTWWPAISPPPPRARKWPATSLTFPRGRAGFISPR